MLIQNTSTQSLDTLIKNLQKDVHDNIGWANIEAYGRVYRFVRDDKFILPGHFSEDTKEYTDVFMNDKYNATLFFLNDGDHVPTDSSRTKMKTEVKLVVIADVKTLYQDNAHRSDLEAREDVIRICKKHKAFEIKKVETDMSSIFRGYSYGLINLAEIHPRHAFAVVFDLKYKMNC